MAWLREGVFNTYNDGMIFGLSDLGKTIVLNGRHTMGIEIKKMDGSTKISN